MGTRFVLINIHVKCAVQATLIKTSHIALAHGIITAVKTCPWQNECDIVFCLGNKGNLRHLDI